MFDFTKNIPLDDKNLKLYRKLQAIVYALSIAAGIALFFIIVFPTKVFTYSFLAPGSNKGNALNPRNDQGIESTGEVGTQEKFIFDATLFGTYNEAQITIIPNKNNSIEDGQIQVEKSYKAFFYPQGDPIGFKDGTLVQNGNNYYLVSNGQLRQFQDLSIVTSLGYSPSAFINATSDDLKYNPLGDPISSKTSYPDNTLFKINDTYYLLKNQKLDKFVSTAAFLSNYQENEAITKDESLLNTYPLSGNILGFSDGSLVTYGVAAYVVSEGMLLPIDSPDTYLGQGYVWDDLIRIGGDEFSLYQKGKLFTIYSVHPTGTIYHTMEDNKWYMIQDSQKHALPSNTIASSWNRKTPIAVSSKSAEDKEKCTLTKKSSLFGSYYYCSIPLTSLQDLIGRYYEFQMVNGQDTKLTNLDVRFKRDVNMDNFKQTLRELFLKVKGRYVSPTQNPTQ